MKNISVIGSMLMASIGCLIGWLCWFPFREWCFSQIPAAAQWAGLAKLLMVILIGYFGGIALPLLFIFLAAYLFVQGVK